MSADSLDNFAYLRATEHTSKAQRKHCWAVAIGLQAVDGLRVSTYLEDQARSYISGEKTLEEVGALVRAYHSAENSNETHDIDSDNKTSNDNCKGFEEADLVSQRIAELLARGAFYLAPEMLVDIHRYLFQDLDQAIYHAGEFKTERMVKQEEILNGDSVLYADPLTYDMSLKGAFASEAAKAYGAFTNDELKSFCHTISFLWQIHPFYEGNTRAIAVFSELYLNYLGFQVENEPFAQHARYYRDALVRAMYRNAAAGIFPDDRYLVAFYENLLGFSHNELNREELMCPALFDNPSLLRNIDPQEALIRTDK